jgi:hypothetical protein
MVMMSSIIIWKLLTTTTASNPYTVLDVIYYSMESDCC